MALTRPYSEAQAADYLARQQQGTPQDPRDTNNDGTVDATEALIYKIMTEGIPDPDGGSSGGGRTLAEDLEYLRAQYGLDTEQKLMLLREEAAVNNDYDIQKMVKQFQLSGEQELMLLAEKYKYDLSTELTVMREKAGLDHDENQINRDFTRMENATDREWKTLEAVEDRKWQTGEKLKEFEFSASESQKGRDFQGEQNALNNEFDLKLKSMDIGAQQALQQARIAADLAMQKTDLSFKDKIAAADRAMDKELALLKIGSDEKMQLKDLAMREALTKMEIASSEKINQDKIAADKEMQEKGFAHDSAEKKQDRELERNKVVAEMMGKDPVRAVLYAMGISGNTLGDKQFADLGAMEGAEEYKAQTEQALNAIEGTGGNAQINAQGVQGIAPIEKQARSFVQGGQNKQTLLTSAHGVGDSAAGGGVAPEEVVQRALAVTPQGYQTQRAAYGDNTITPNTTYIKDEGPNWEGTKPDAITVGQGG